MVLHLTMIWYIVILFENEIIIINMEELQYLLIL